MDREQIIEFINKNHTCYLATCEGKQPRVRGMMTYKADKDGILFHTGRSKDLHEQIAANPQVELCYFDPATNVQVRVTGKAQIAEDLNLQKQIVKDRPFLRPVVERFGCGALVVFRVTGGQADVWTFATNLDPKQPIKLSS